MATNPTRRPSSTRASTARRTLGAKATKAAAPPRGKGKFKVETAPAEPVLPELLEGPQEVLAERLIGLPPAVAKAIKLAREQVGQMVKSAKNDYAGYNYVPIDKYYEQAVPIIEGCDLGIDAQEEAVIPAGDFLLWKFRGILTYIKDGSRYDIGSVTIPHRYDGPQSAGSAHSYADKTLMRRFFKIATGEPDGDSQNPARGRASRALAREDRRVVEQQQSYQRDVARYDHQDPVREPEPAPEKVWPEVPETAYNPLYDFTDYVRKGTSIDELTELYRRAKSRIETFHPHDQKWIIDLFARRKEGVQAQQGGMPS